MKVIYLRFNHTLLATLVQARERHRTFLRLLQDRPTGIRIETREKAEEADIEAGYPKRLAYASVLSTLIIAFLFLLYPEYQSVVILSTQTRPIQIESIPETRQAQRPPSPPRPSVPIPVESEEVPEDVTIVRTELDLDVLDLRLGDVASGPPSDVPLDLTGIELTPRPKRMRMPKYPRQAKKSKIEGDVVILVLVDKKGRVQNAEVVSGPEIFRASALSAAREYRYEPIRYNGQIRKALMYVTIRFFLK